MPILSIIIPTHERFRYAKETVETILAMDTDIELVLCDTSAVNNWVSFPQNERLKVVRPDTGISVVDNFNIALSYATGNYICFIGDDDLVARDIVEIARHAMELDVDAIRFTFPIEFYWQDFLHRSNPEAYSGTVWIKHYSGKIRALDTHRALKESAAKLGHGVFEMPRAYCGIISRPLVKRIVEEHDSLFGGVSPDIYSAALIAAYAKKALEIDFPAVISGSSGASTAGQSAAGRHVGNLRDNAHIRPFKSLIWHPLVPEFYSVPTVWSYSLVQALERIEMKPSVRPHWGRLYVQCLVFYRQYLKFTLVSMKNYVRENSVFSLCATLLDGLFWEGIWALSRIRRRMFVRLQTTRDQRVSGINSSAAVSKVIEKTITEGPKPNWDALK